MKETVMNGNESMGAGTVQTRGLCQGVDRTLICPRDGSSLVLHQQGQTRLHSCDACHGLWIAPAQLRQWVERPNVVPAAATRRSRVTIQRGGAADVFCPACQDTRLLIRKIDRIEVDVCPTCRGLWLDSGELDGIVKWHRRKQKSTSRRGECNSLVWDGLDGAVNAATSSVDLLNVVGDALGGAADVAGDAAGAVVGFIFEGLGSLF